MKSLITIRRVLNIRAVIVDEPLPASQSVITQQTARMVDWKKLLSAKPSLDVPGLETVNLNDKEMEKRIVWKQDIRILPWICITYLLSG